MHGSFAQKSPGRQSNLLPFPARSQHAGGYSALHNLAISLQHFAAKSPDRGPAIPSEKYKT
jgi:hypothetical protein